MTRPRAYLVAAALGACPLVALSCSTDPGAVTDERDDAAPGAPPVDVPPPPEAGDAGAPDASADADAEAPAVFLEDDEMVGTYRAYFSLPKPGATDYAIVEKLAEYIGGTPKGATIRGHITTLSRPIVTDALIAAQKRGVTVYIVQNGNPTPESQRLAAALGQNHVVCGDAALDVTSCVSTLPGATHHLKDWMFSSTTVGGTAHQHVTWVTSQNLTVSTSRMFNDAFVVLDNEDFYDAHVASFASFFNQERTDDFYNVKGRGHHVIPSANAEMSFAPQTTSKGHTSYHASNDHVAEALSRVQVAEPGCFLKVAALSLFRSRSALIDEFLRIRALGCTVQIAFTDGNAGAFDRLNGQVELRNAKDPGIHSKMMVYRGNYDGAPGRSMVWGGSHNFSMGSLRQRDEIFVAVSRHALADAYVDYFDAVWKTTQPAVRPAE